MYLYSEIFFSLIHVNVPLVFLLTSCVTPVVMCNMEQPRSTWNTSGFFLNTVMRL
jgi:hypothetical protein